jgi:hypothetical protein
MRTKPKSRWNVKATVKKRTLNSGLPMHNAGDPFGHHDAKGRMGTFESAGEHARVRGRTSGIVGQTTKRFSTQKRKKKG